MQRPAHGIGLTGDPQARDQPCGRRRSLALPTTTLSAARTVPTHANPDRRKGMTRTTTALAATAALIGGATLAVTAQGQNQPPQTITLHGGPAAKRDVKQIDVKPRGTSIGDQTLAAETLRREGTPIGRALVDCTALDASYGGPVCVVTLLTREGQITAQGASEHRALPGSGGDPGTAEVFAITGGTGTYAGATGNLRLRSTSKGDTFTLTLGATA
jgi:hypothetical protein